MWDESNSGGSGGGNIKPSDLLDQYKDTVKMAEKLADVLNDNHTLRSKKRELESQVRDLEAKTPKEGAVVLSGDDASRWQAYQQYGTPDEIKARLDSLATAESELTKQHRALAIQAAVESGGYVKDRFAALLPDDALPVVKEEQKDGKPIKRVFISQGEKETPIEEHDRFKPFLDTLTTTQQSGTRLPPMGSGRDMGAAPTVEQVKEQKRASGRYSA
jgi:hypothetical protein